MVHSGDEKERERESSNPKAGKPKARIWESLSQCQFKSQAGIVRASRAQKFIRQLS